MISAPKKSRSRSLRKRAAVELLSLREKVLTKVAMMAHGESMVVRVLQMLRMIIPEKKTSNITGGIFNAPLSSWDESMARRLCEALGVSFPPVDSELWQLIETGTLGKTLAR